MPLKLLFVGRFARNKGIHILIKAIKKLNNQGFSDRIQFHLVGKGPLYDQYARDYAYKNLLYHGYVDDEELNILYKNSHAFVLPTLFEGMPTVVLEAMKYGLPIIVTNVGAALELVDSSNGFIVRKNDVQSLVDTIKDFYFLSLDNKQALSKKSYDKVCNKFSWQIVAKKHRKLFDSLAVQENFFL